MTQMAVIIFIIIIIIINKAGPNMWTFDIIKLLAK